MAEFLIQVGFYAVLAILFAVTMYAVDPHI